MSSLESYDGLCGLIARFSGLMQLRCNYCIGHHGPCSWDKLRSQFTISSSCCAREPTDEENFIASVIASMKVKEDNK